MPLAICFELKSQIPLAFCVVLRLKAGSWHSFFVCIPCSLLSSLLVLSERVKLLVSRERATCLLLLLLVFFHFLKNLKVIY